MGNCSNHYVPLPTFQRMFTCSYPFFCDFLYTRYYPGLPRDESGYFRLGTLATVLDREESCNSLWILEKPAVNLIVLFGYFRLGTLATVLDVKESFNFLRILSISYKFHENKQKNIRYRPKSTFLDTAQHVFTRLNTSPDLPRLNRIILKQGSERWQRYYGWRS